MYTSADGIPVMTMLDIPAPPAVNTLTVGKTL